MSFPSSDHWYERLPVPVAVTLRTAESPRRTVWLDDCDWMVTAFPSGGTVVVVEGGVVVDTGGWVVVVDVVVGEATVTVAVAVTVCPSEFETVSV